MIRAETPRLHVVTDDRILSVDAGFRDRAREILRAGGGSLALHLRGPGSSGALLFERARELLPAAREAGARLVINDRVDVALAVGADGVHLGRRSLAPSTVRELVGAGVPAGASVHSVEEAVRARDEGADYLFVGTIFPSASHPDRPPSGTGLLKEVSGVVNLPLIAIGGVEPGRVRRAIEAGAHGVASITAVWNARDPAGAVEDFLGALAGGAEKEAP